MCGGKWEVMKVLGSDAYVLHLSEALQDLPLTAALTVPQTPMSAEPASGSVWGSVSCSDHLPACWATTTTAAGVMRTMEEHICGFCFRQKRLITVSAELTPTLTTHFTSPQKTTCAGIFSLALHPAHPLTSEARVLIQSTRPENHAAVWIPEL